MNTSAAPHLQAFKSQYGHCNVPQKYKKNPSLGSWLAQQRISMRKMQLESKSESTRVETQWERISRLEQLGVVSSIGTKVFDHLNSCEHAMFITRQASADV